MSLASRAKDAAHRRRLWNALTRIEREEPVLATPDGKVSVRIEDLRWVLERERYT